MPGTGIKADDSIAVPISTTARRNLASLLKEAADYLTNMASNYDTAEALLQRALALELEEKCLARASTTLQKLGMVNRLRGDTAAAQRYLDRCLGMRESLSRRSDAPSETNQALAQTLQEMSLLALRQGNLDEAKNLLSRCRSVFPDSVAVGGGEGCIRLAMVNVSVIGQEEHAHIVCDIIDECCKHAKVLAYTVHDFDNDGVFVSVRVDAHPSFVKDAIINRTFGEEQHCVHCADKLT
jgi:tetratricopeptide (TPR) repeat protein